MTARELTADRCSRLAREIRGAGLELDLSSEPCPGCGCRRFRSPVEARAAALMDTAARRLIKARGLLSRTEGGEAE